jgi:acetyl esterase
MQKTIFEKSNPQFFRHFDRLDADLQLVVKQLLAFNAPPIENLDPASARSNPTFKNAVEEIASHNLMVRTLNVAASNLPEKVGRVEQTLIPTRDGNINARLFFPKTNQAFPPVIVYFHGGGWVIADLNAYESSCRALCNATMAIVVSVAYRQAPEHKYPAPLNDAYDALQWVLHHATEFGGDPNRTAVAGESAGGNLATVCCLMAKEKGGKMPVGQLLVYPVTDTSRTQASYSENMDTQPLHTAMMPWFFKHYLADPSQALEKYVSPLHAPDLRGLPPALVITAEFDPLRDEGEQYADKLRRSGVEVQCQRFNGVTHEFFGLAGAVSKAKQAVELAAQFLTTLFDRKIELSGKL